jgi:C4-type Zn-finger protein
VTLHCPVCLGRIRVERVNVTVEGDEKTITVEGVCEKCGAKYTLTRKIYLRVGPKYAKHPYLAVARG